VWFLRKSKSSEEAEAALKEAEKSLCEVQKRGVEVSQVSSALKGFRERNHFIEQMEEIFVRKQGTIHDA
jgi:hypothetical protein